jgi:acid phosphatase class B
MIWCFDLDGTITEWPSYCRALMCALQDAGHEVHILTGWKGEVVTDAVIRDKQALLDAFQITCYSKLVVVAQPENNVADQKVEYMRQSNAHVLVDNDKENCKAAKKAGLMAMRVYGRDT